MNLAYYALWIVPGEQSRRLSHMHIIYFPLIPLCLFPAQKRNTFINFQHLFMLCVRSWNDDGRLSIMARACWQHKFVTVSMNSTVFSLIINLGETEVEEPGHDNTLTIQCTCAAACWDAASGQKLDQHVEEVFHSAEHPVPAMQQPWSQL